VHGGENELKYLFICGLKPYKSGYSFLYMVKKSGIVTPTVLPGEPGWEKLKEKKERAKSEKTRVAKKKAPLKIGNITMGDKAFRLGRATQNIKGDRKYAIWRYKRKIGEIMIKGPEDNSEVSLKLTRLGGIGNYKHLIQDADFQLSWMTREQELLMTQKECYVCKKKISKTAAPNLFHYNLFKKRTKILEEADRVPAEVVSGKLSIADGWRKFNDIIEDGNRYYMSLKDTALICAACAKSKGIKE
jgi:hypothetical protein